MLRVMICDDSPGYAGALRRVLESDGDIEVVAICASAQQAIAKLASGGSGGPPPRPPERAVDLLAIDIGLPGMNGLEAIEEIMSSRPLPVLVLMPNAAGTGDAAAAVLAAGALEAIGRDEVNLADPAGASGVALRNRVRLLAKARVIRHPRARLRRSRRLPGRGRHVSAIGFCASTGGPKILGTVLAALPASYPIPLLVVQHISPGFTAGLVRWLNLTADMPVRVASDGAAAGNGAWIAPEGANLKLGHTGRLELDWLPTEEHHLPSGDVLLSSIAASAGRAGVAVVLTGMGKDGARGAAAVRLAGGLAIAQDEESSAVYGMPRAAAETGVDLVLSPAEIISYLRGLSYQPLAGEPAAAEGRPDGRGRP